MNDSWNGDTSTTGEYQRHSRGTSRFNHRHYRTQHLRHPSLCTEHDHDSGTDDNELTPIREFTSILVVEEGHKNLHYRHHSSPEVLANLSMNRLDDDDYPLHHRSRPSSPPPPPTYSPGSNGCVGQGMYHQQQQKFNSPYRRAAHISSPNPTSQRAHYLSPVPGSHAFPSLQHPHHGSLHRRRKWSIKLLLRAGAAVCTLAYLAVVLRSKVLLDRWAGDRIDDGDASHPVPAYSESWQGGGGGGGSSSSSTAHDGSVEIESAAAVRAREWNKNERRHVVEKRERRTEERRRRTRPPRGGTSEGAQILYLARHDFSILDERQVEMPISPKKTGSDAPYLSDVSTDESLPSPATFEQLCGSEARDASLKHPNSYLGRDALNSKSRVLITGILNPIGFHLSLALQELCGVKTIMGIDPMYPNSVLHRMELQKRIAILTKAIPSLGQPIMLPYVGLDPRLNSKKAAEAAKAEGSLLLPLTHELNFLTFRPTHIVHLASALPDAYRDEEGRREGKRNDNSPYCGSLEDPRAAPLFEIRQAAAGMEHLMMSLATARGVTPPEGSVTRPHFTYASHADVYRNTRKGREWKGKGKEPEVFHPASMLVDEVLAATYGSLRDIYSVGLRFSEVYGPWGMSGSRMYNLTEGAVGRWGLSFKRDNTAGGELDFDGPEHSGTSSLGSPLKRFRDELKLGSEVGESKTDFLFVDDAVSAIIAAMQYRKEGSHSVVFDVASGEQASLFEVADMMEDLMPRNGSKDTESLVKTKSVASAVLNRAQEELNWSPKKSFRDGIIETLAWHLDKKIPYGPTTAASDPARLGIIEETGDALLIRQKMQPCAANETLCLRGRRRLPCASECNGPAVSTVCTPSPFDSVIPVTKKLTEGCDVVLYTSSLGYDVEDINLRATYEDPVEEEQEVCNVAFVPSGSTLVKRALSKVPESSLKRVGLDEEEGTFDVEKRLDALNGRILHRGWVLVWVPNAIRELPLDILTIPKMSPGKLFAPSAQRAMFVDENFTVTPNTDDVLFIASEMHRKALPARTFVQKDEGGKKHKYQLPAEPERRAAILFNMIKQRRPKDDKSDGSIVPKANKLSVYEAAKFMVFEIGGDPTQSDPKPLKQQREFYERIPTFVNRDDLRSIYEPAHRYEMQHWVRSRWVLHDLSLEEGRQLRCEWYEEHLQWGNNLDQLSFAHVMARHEIKRKFARNEPDDHMRAVMPKHPELEGTSDSGEWHQILRMDESLGGKGNPLLRTVEKVPEHMFDPDEEEEGEREAELYDENGGGAKKAEVDLFVRIMSDKVMLMSRREWQRSKA